MVEIENGEMLFTNVVILKDFILIEQYIFYVHYPAVLSSVEKSLLS